MSLMAQPGRVEHSFAAMARSSTPKETPEGRRLRLLREALGETNASAFAMRVGLSPSRWANVETGGLGIGRDFAQRLIKAVPGLSVDWLWFGERRGLSYDLARRLAEAESAENGTKTGVARVG